MVSDAPAHSAPTYKTHTLLTHTGITHGFFGRHGGISKTTKTGNYASLNVGQGSDDTPEAVFENRRRVAHALGTTEPRLLSLSQIHSTDVLIVDRSFDGPPPKADGLVTRTPGLAISALSADCGPVLFVDPESRTIGACHAGWRGALAGITDQTLSAMESLGADRANIRTVLGPCISQANYEVGADFRDSFVAEDESYDRFFTLAPPKKAGDRRPHFDLKRFLLARLRNAGLTHIDSLPDCTYGDPERYFSYRYNTHHGLGDYGRNISVIMLTET